MCLLGLIGEYLGRIYICINDSPQYVIRETINLDAEGKEEEKRGE
jgi:undecaprenyl-phosphate 4-deoxy-4-formamido-L-arabinose transferase